MERKAVITKPDLDEVEAADDGGLYFSGHTQKKIDFIRSGSTQLDCVLGGGWAIGRVGNIVGDKSTGKTLLAMEALANFVADYPDGVAFYAEVEAAFDKDYALALGIPIHKVEFVEGLFTVEDMFNNLDDIIKQIDEQKSNVPILYIIDSLDALSDASEMERDIEKGTMGANKAKQLSKLFRILNQKLAKRRIFFLVISQVRDNIGVTFGRKTTRSGGRALDFYASQVIYLAQIKTHKKTKQKVERPVGIRIRAKCDKNKVGLPFRECEFDIMFGYGVDDFAANVEWLNEVGALDRVTDQPYDKFIKSSEKLSDDEFFQCVKVVQELVKLVWVEVESRFMPARKKPRI